MANYNENYVKRRAKKIKGAKQIPHHQALDQASQELGFHNWGHFRNLSSCQALNSLRGALVRFKDGGCLGIAVKEIDEMVMCYTHWGPVHCMRWEISVCPDQTEAPSFRPMRIVLPYGKWTCVDGTEVLFNRDYFPIWKKQANGVIIAADPLEWVRFSKEEYFFGDHNNPYEDRDSNRVCMTQLHEWGVQDRSPVMLDMFRKAIAAGDLTLIEKPTLSKMRSEKGPF